VKLRRVSVRRVQVVGLHKGYCQRAPSGPFQRQALTCVSRSQCQRAAVLCCAVRCCAARTGSAVVLPLPQP